MHGKGKLCQWRPVPGLELRAAWLDRMSARGVSEFFWFIHPVLPILLFSRILAHYLLINKPNPRSSLNLRAATTILRARFADSDSYRHGRSRWVSDKSLANIKYSYFISDSYENMFVTDPTL